MALISEPRYHRYGRDTYDITTHEKYQFGAVINPPHTGAAVNALTALVTELEEAGAFRLEEYRFDTSPSSSRVTYTLTGYIPHKAWVQRYIENSIQEVIARSQRAAATSLAAAKEKAERLTIAADSLRFNADPPEETKAPEPRDPDGHIKWVDFLSERVEKETRENFQKVGYEVPTRHPLGVRGYAPPTIHDDDAPVITYEERVRKIMERMAPNVACNIDHPEHVPLRYEAVKEQKAKQLQQFREGVEAKREEACECSAKKCGPPHHHWCPAVTGVLRRGTMI
jgi:hypothetical protein